MVGYNPGELRELLELLSAHKNATIYAGGTDLMVARKFEENVIFIAGVPELKTISHQEGYLVLGACLTYKELLEAELPEIMKEVFRMIASPAIRNRGTIGGNICNASPAGDTLPMLYALSAEVGLKSLGDDGEVKSRILPISDYILGIRRIDRRPGEVLCTIRIPEELLSENTEFYYKKVGARRAEAISKLSFFGAAKCRGDVIESVHAAFGAVGVTVVNPREEEQIFSGMKKSELLQNRQELIAAYQRHIKPIDDQRSTADYRKCTAESLLGDFIDRIANS